MKRDTFLIVADSEHDANMLYAVRMFIPDPFIYLRLNGRCHIVVRDLELDRARRQARHCHVVAWSDCERDLQRQGIQRPGFAHVINFLLRRRRLRKVSVPVSFPLQLAEQLRRLGVIVEVKDEPFYPARELKCAEEVKKISAALTMAEVGLAEAIQALKNSKVARTGRLMYHNNPLTSEKLQGIIGAAIFQAGGVANHTIVAGGRQGCDPHETGHGVLRANQPIIIDVFPRSQKTGYFGDITRTVVRGRASEQVRKLYHTVARAQSVAFAAMQDQTPARDVHRRVHELFEAEGYKTGRRDGRMQGFFHGTGHGLGLEIHESPRMSFTSTDRLRTGQVVTVEPGLYYPDLGGVRLEDVALITNGSPRNLTKFEKILEI